MICLPLEIKISSSSVSVLSQSSVQDFFNITIKIEFFFTILKIVESFFEWKLWDEGYQKGGKNLKKYCIKNRFVWKMY